MPSTPVRVLLVGDHPVMRDGLQQLLERTGEFEVVGHAGDGEEAVVVWAVRNGLLRRLAAGAHCGEAAPAPDPPQRLP